MRIKLDENLPAGLAHILGAIGHDVDTAPREGLKGRDDPTIWRAAQQAGRFLMTQDLDFSDVRKFLPGSHHGVLVVRLRRPSRGRLIERIEQLFRSEAVETWSGGFVVVTASKVRVRYASQG